MDVEKGIKVTTQILAILAENECTIAEANSVLHMVKNEIKDSAIVPLKNYHSKLTDYYRNRGLLPRH